MTIPELITAFGGPTKIAQDFDTTRHAVMMWRRSGIPAKHHIALRDAARKRRIAGVTVDVLRQKPPARSPVPVAANA